MMVKVEEFSFTSSDGVQIAAYKWAVPQPKALVQIAHGAVEHAMRYDAFAQSLCERGFAVYAEDHLGHGRTAGSPDKVGHYSDNDGAFLKIVEDIHALDARMRREYPGLPVFLIGHSMGSLLSRVYASKYGGGLSGLVLTGTGHVAPALIAAVQFLARREMKKFGYNHRSPFLHSLVFGTLNKPFKGEHGCEFISADPEVVAAYVADPCCGNTVTAEFAYELLEGTKLAAKKETFAQTPAALPVFIGAGEFDTMGGKKLSAVKKDAADYQNAGVKDFTFRIYPGMRHEILNEKGKKQVWEDIAGWMESRIPKK
jgi:alpha-beta hydrolase superfamily lysophospholipase